MAWATCGMIWELIRVFFFGCHGARSKGACLFSPDFIFGNFLLLPIKNKVRILKMPVKKKSGKSK